MTPSILISTNPKRTQDFLDSYAKTHTIPQTHIYSLFPEATEFSIDQIKEIKKQVMFHVNKPSLYILHDFHKSSFEAQNAFLKTLEEHGSTIHFILVVTNQHKLLETIQSRANIVNLILELPQEKTDISRGIQDFIENNNNSFLHELTIQLKSDSHQTPTEIIDEIVSFFSDRLVKDKKSSFVLREILDARFLLENNHIDPQLTLDHIFILIKKNYIL